MIEFPQYQRWLADEVKKTQEANPQLNRGDLLGFLYSPNAKEEYLPQDLFVLLIAVEIRTTGQGKGLWGSNLYLVPGKSNRDKLYGYLISGIGNLSIASELHRNSTTRKTYRYYHKSGIISPILIFNKEQLEKLK